nr:hypothetical protein Iba_chr05aCG9700 [Ipomoea batatas]
MSTSSHGAMNILKKGEQIGKSGYSDTMEAHVTTIWEVTAWVSRFLEGHAEPFMKIYEQHMESIMVREEDYPELQRYIFAQNKVILREIWPREGIQPDVSQDNEIYYEIIKSASNQYYYELSQVQKEDICYFNYSTESDTALDEDSVTDLQFHGEWMIMKTKQPNWNPQNWKGKRFMSEG